MALKPWLNADGQPLLIDGAPALCEECPCNPSVNVSCCVNAGLYVNGAAIVPASAVEVDDSLPCAGGLFPYADLIVEIPNPGYTALCARQANGLSFSVPNGQGSAMQIPHQTSYNIGGCLWQSRFTFTGSECSGGSDPIEISVNLEPGHIRGLISLVCPSCNGGTGSIQWGIMFQQTIAAPGVFDLTAPFDIPFVGYTDAGFVWHASNPPLRISF